MAAHVAELPDLLHSDTKAWRRFPTVWTQLPIAANHCHVRDDG